MASSTQVDPELRPVAERLGSYAAGLARARLDDLVTHKAVSCLVDAVGIALAASDHRTCVAFQTLLLRTGATPGTARVWQDGTSAPLGESVAANGIAVHAYMQDDVDMAAWSHPGSVIVPVAVGACEASGASLDTALRAIVSGYSVLHWLGTGIGRGMLDRGFRTSPTYGAVAAAATAATALGLSADVATRAVATSAAVAGAVTGSAKAGFADWPYQNASAGWLGLCAARIAAAGGCDANPEIFEGPNGFLAKFAGFEPPAGLPGTPTPEAILATWTHPHALGLEMGIQNVAVTAAAWKVRQDHGLVPAQIDRVKVHQNAEFAAPAGSSFRGAFDWPKQAFGSTLFAVATTLVHGELRHAHYLHHREDRDVMSLIDRIEIVPQESYGYLDGRVEVQTTSGATFVADASDLPSTYFQRDARATGEVFDSILAERGVAPGRGMIASDAVFGEAAMGGRRTMSNVLDELLIRP